MDHIINVRLLRQLVSKSNVSGNHKAVLEALETVFPTMHVEYMGMEKGLSFGNSLLLDEELSIVSIDAKTWLVDLYHEVDGNLNLIFEKLNSAKYLMGEQRCNNLYFSVRMSPTSDDFYQVIVEEYTSINIQGYIFRNQDDICKAHNFDELLELMYDLSYLDEHTVHNSHYRLLNVLNIKKFLQQRYKYVSECNALYSENSVVDKYHGCTTALPEKRFLDDWESSSASHLSPEKYWFFDLILLDCDDYADLLPTPLEQKCLKPIPYDTSQSIAEIWKEMEMFDEQAGYSFAWYFHMVHGGRIDQRVGKMIHDHIGAAVISLLPCDAAVLSQWCDSPYGF